MESIIQLLQQHVIFAVPAKSLGEILVHHKMNCSAGVDFSWAFYEKRVSGKTLSMRSAQGILGSCAPCSNQVRKKLNCKKGGGGAQISPI